MIVLALTVGRYLFLGLFFFFIYKMLKMIASDLKSPSHQQKTPVELVVVEGDEVSYSLGEVLKLRKVATFGRSKDNNIVLPDIAVSKVHAKVWEANGQWWLEDLNSKNGTWVNDVRITKSVPLTNGDKVKIGAVVFQFVRWNYEVQ